MLVYSLLRLTLPTVMYARRLRIEFTAYEICLGTAQSLSDRYVNERLLKGVNKRVLYARDVPVVILIMV